MTFAAAPLHRLFPLEQLTALGAGEYEVLGFIYCCRVGGRFGNGKDLFAISALPFCSKQLRIADKFMFAFWTRDMQLAVRVARVTFLNQNAWRWNLQQFTAPGTLTRLSTRSIRNTKESSAGFTIELNRHCGKGRIRRIGGVETEMLRWLKATWKSSNLQ